MLAYIAKYHDSSMDETGQQNHGEVVIYQSADGVAKMDVLLQDETVWLTADRMANLFQRDKSSLADI